MRFEVHRRHVSSNSVHRSAGLERKQMMFAVRQYQLATSVPIDGHVRDHCRSQLLLYIWQSCRDLTSFCRAGWPREGVTTDSRVRSSCCKNSLAGDEPVVACGMLL